jgi:hypothetical protein
MKATSGGKELKVQDGKSVFVSFPKKGGAEKMELYKPDTKGGWELAGKPNTVNADAAEGTTSAKTGGLFKTIQVSGERTNDLNKQWHLDSIRLMGYRGSLYNYIDDSKTIPESIVTLANGKTSYIEVKCNISSSGKMVNIRFSGQKILNKNVDSDPLFDSIMKYLKTVPALDLKTYATKHQLPIPDSKDPMFKKDVVFAIFVNDLDRTNFASLRARKKGGMSEGHIDTDQLQKDYGGKNRGEIIKEIKDLDPETFIFETNQLGWINCDYRWNTNDEKINYYVRMKNNSNTTVCLVFDDIRSLMQGDNNGEGFEFHNLPVGRKIKVIAVKYENNHPSYTSFHTIVSREVKELDNFREFSLAQLEKEINGGE